MIYGHADHNLTPAMIEDLLEMEQSGSDDNLNINKPQEITKELVKKLIKNTSTNALEIANFLLQGERYQQ